jgi:hypothetical protein
MARMTFNSFIPNNSMSVRPDLWSLFQRIIFRSTAYAIAAYFMVMIAERLLILAGSLIKGFSVVLKPDTVKVLAPPSSWDQETVLLIYLIPFFILIISFIWLNIRFMKMEFVSKFSKLFMLWIMFFILYRVAAMISSQLIFKTGIDYILSWLYFGIVIKLLAGVIAAVVFFIAGFKILKGILAIAGNYHSNIRLLGMSNLILSAIYVPLAAVITLAIFFHLPKLVNEELPGLGLLTVLLVYFIFKMSPVNPRNFDINEDVRGKVSPKLLLFVVIGSVVIVRIFLGLEISFL